MDEVESRRRRGAFAECDGLEHDDKTPAVASEVQVRKWRRFMAVGIGVPSVNEAYGWSLLFILIGSFASNTTPSDEVGNERLACRLGQGVRTGQVCLPPTTPS